MKVNKTIFKQQNDFEKSKNEIDCRKTEDLPATNASLSTWLCYLNDTFLHFNPCLEICW